ncbi:flagellar protein FlaG [Aquipseudomonas alcaligenes]|uniref:Flagellar protein FlaG n=1 Tax=Aquipseudomonas alcaligenes TaxID=43263 RepID=A0AA42SQX9_AQUAC|nr:flagellar protein FlaG [Pseudomonas alcaligenes]MDH1053369.1 flagellar protein FlaG [Pseudomonas alcaligenes]
MDVGPIKNSALGSMPTLRLAASAEKSAAVAGEQENTQQGVQAVSAAEGESARAQVEDAVSTIQGFVQSVRRNLDFQLDDSTGRVVVKVTDSESGDVIRQIPSEEALKLAESLEEVRSLLFKAEA